MFWQTTILSMNTVCCLPNCKLFKKLRFTKTCYRKISKAGPALYNGLVDNVPIRTFGFYLPLTGPAVSNVDSTSYQRFIMALRKYSLFCDDDVTAQRQQTYALQQGWFPSMAILSIFSLVGLRLSLLPSYNAIKQNGSPKIMVSYS